MAKKKAAESKTTANIGFEAKLWLAADKLRNNMDAAEYKHVVLGLMLPEEHPRPALDKPRWGELETPALPLHHSLDLLRRVNKYFLMRFTSTEGRRVAVV